LRLSPQLRVQVTIVIADGSILTADDQLNTDLFWAIRGGGCNFGVVTEFVYHYTRSGGMSLLDH